MSAMLAGPTVGALLACPGWLISPRLPCRLTQIGAGFKQVQQALGSRQPLLGQMLQTPPAPLRPPVHRLSDPTRWMSCPLRRWHPCTPQTPLRSSRPARRPQSRRLPGLSGLQRSRRSQLRQRQAQQQLQRLRLCQWRGCVGTPLPQLVWGRGGTSRPRRRLWCRGTSWLHRGAAPGQCSPGCEPP